MAAFTITIPGSNEDMNELRRRFTELGVELGYGARRGASAGRGSMSGLLRGIGEGEVALVARRAPDDFRWLAALLEGQLVEHPERAGFIRDALIGLEWADSVHGLPEAGVSEDGKVEVED
jgi:hypothetical protein